MPFQSAGEYPLALPRFVSVRELAKLMALNEFTVYHWVKEAPERLPRVTRVHGRVLFIESDVRAWFDARHSQPASLGAESPPAKPQAAKRGRGRPRKTESGAGRQLALEVAQ